MSIAYSHDQRKENRFKMNDRTKLIIANVCTFTALALALTALYAMLTDNPSLSWARNFIPVVTILIISSVVLRRKARKDI